MALFAPNLTSKLILGAASSVLANGHRVLELGCGSGWITQELIRHASANSIHASFSLSDVSPEAVVAARDALTGLVAGNRIRVGDAAQPWTNERFDLVINDIAAIPDGIAARSDWYRDVPCNAGTDGLCHARRVLSQISNILDAQGIYIVPLISLSNITEHRMLLNENFHSVEDVIRKQWPLPASLLAHSAYLEELRAGGIIDVEKRHGMLLATTAVAVCTGLR